MSQVFDAAVDQVNQWLCEASQHANFPALKLDTEGSCSFYFDGSPTIVLKVTQDGKQLLLLSYVVSSSVIDDDAFYKTLLGWNFSADFLKGGMLAYCDRANKVALINRYNILDLDEKYFFNMIQNYFSRLQQCIERIHNEIGDPSAPLDDHHQNFNINHKRV